MTQNNKPSLSNVLSPGQSVPYFKSNMGSMFYVAWGIFISIAITLYFAKGMLPFGTTALYTLMTILVVLGMFLADRIQFAYDNQGALILYPSSVKSSDNLATDPSTDGKTGSQKGSGIHTTYSFWLYDNEAVSKPNRYIFSRKYYSDGDLFKVDSKGNKVPKKGIHQYTSKQPSVHLNEHNMIVYTMQDPSSSNQNDVKHFHSEYAVPKQEWTNVQIVQSQTDVSIYMNNRLDSVHTFPTIETPTLIAKGELVMFPAFDNSNSFGGEISRFFYFNRVVDPTTLHTVYSIGPVQGTTLYELLKSILDIPNTLIRSLFVF